MATFIGIYKTDYHDFLIKRNPRSPIPKLKKNIGDNIVVIHQIVTKGGLEFFNLGKNTIYSLTTASFMYDIDNDKILKNRGTHIPQEIKHIIDINRKIKSHSSIGNYNNMTIAETLYIGGHKHHELIDKLQDELTFVEQVIYGMEIDNIDINIIKSKFPEYVI